MARAGPLSSYNDARSVYPLIWPRFIRVESTYRKLLSNARDVFSCNTSRLFLTNPYLVNLHGNETTPIY